MIARDRLSSLPDEILIPILSQLDIKEAVRSSILSRRWVDLWKYRESLDFHTATFVGLNNIRTLSTLDEFRVGVAHADSEICPPDVGEWMKFALQKQLKKLEINLCNYFLYGDVWGYLLSALRNFSCKSLVVLRLTNVNLNEDEIRCLSNIPFLEEITLRILPGLVNLDIDIPMPRLKHLEIYRCAMLTRLQVSAPNLLFFLYIGPNIKMVPFKDDILHLDQLTIGGDYLEFFLFEFSKWQSHQVKRLQLDIFHDSIVSNSIIWLSSLLQGSPLLHSLDIKIRQEWYKGRPEAVLLESLTKLKEEGSVRCPHKLRKVVVAGCSGSFLTVQLITYLVENATCTEEMNLGLDPRLFPLWRKEFEDGFVDWVTRLKLQMLSGTQLAVHLNDIDFDYEVYGATRDISWDRQSPPWRSRVCQIK